MSIVVNVIIQCDFCPETIQGHTGPKSNIKAAREEAKFAGWRKRRRGNVFVDECPACVKTKEEEVE